MDDDREQTSGETGGGAVGVDGDLVVPGADHAPVSERGRALLASNPGRYRVLSNGAVYDGGDKRIAAAPVRAMTAERIQEMRHQQSLNKLIARQAAIGAIARLSKGDKPSFRQGWDTIVSAQANLAIDTSKGRASTEAARFVRSAAGLDDTKDDNETAGAVIDAAAQFSASFMAKIASLRAAAAAEPAQDKPDDDDQGIIDADIPF